MEMVGNCPACGAPWNGKVCEYCGFEAAAEKPEEVVGKSKYGYSEPQPQQQIIINHLENRLAEDPWAQQSYVSPKSRMVALLLCFFLGFFGAHKFYVGKIGGGILYLFTYGLFGFGWLWDLVMIILGNFQDKNGLKLSRW